VLGSIGHVDEFKGQPLLVEAAPLVLRNCPNTYLLFVGYVDPRMQQALWKRAADLGVADRVRFAGVRNDIPRLLNAMAVVALPSRTEACSMSIIEAMAMGRPVVATRAGGNPELVEHGVTGLLTNRTPQSLAEALSAILTDSSLRARMGAAGRQRAAALFSASAMAENMVSLYSRVLGHA
jgi:glycosyltransferase involved in cell wall biosynthesis